MIDGLELVVYALPFSCVGGKNSNNKCICLLYDREAFKLSERLNCDISNLKINQAMCQAKKF